MGNLDALIAGRQEPGFDEAIEERADRLGAEAFELLSGGSPARVDGPLAELDQPAKHPRAGPTARRG